MKAFLPANLGAGRSMIAILKLPDFGSHQPTRKIEFSSADLQLPSSSFGYSIKQLCEYHQPARNAGSIFRLKNKKTQTASVLGMFNYWGRSEP
ncbi:MULTISPECIES: hypothetical protein [unclassified Paenibacillus]|uniref:hypothetical protein n=1 Tax=unclassified Paenibacillus TaxID=185978 RepID=UPI000B92CDBC|nr:MULTISPECIES: hypothetical protein [unclassified Paenibacillus]ASS67848.1 hypothetical protein CIC07_18200 [Paenibacillus sp. RUD330]